MMLACLNIGVYADSRETTQADAAEISCELNSAVRSRDGGPKTSVVCDYRNDFTFKPVQLALEVGGTKVRLLRDNIKKYPAEGQKTALLAIFDVSDPRRNETTTAFYPTIVEAIAKDHPAHLMIGVTTFAESLGTVVPLQQITPEANLKNISFSATGAATELNRAALTALKRLSAEKADRRILLVVSDGKSEDTAYKLADVVAEAKRLRIPIATIGIAERPSDTPSLQSLRLVAEQSGGVFFDVSDKRIPVDLRSKLQMLVESGGRMYFDGSVFNGKQQVSVILTDTEKKIVTASTEFSFPDVRGWREKAEDFARAYWWTLVAGGVALVGGVLGVLHYRRSRGERRLQNRVVAEFRALDGDETRYQVRKSAVTLGRDTQNDIVITNSSVSARHAELHRTRKGVFRLSDLGSTNGTFVNAARVSAVDLEDGDLVEIAEVRLQFKLFD
jgi:hypothetical protein